jgi:hypothetical protein
MCGDLQDGLLVHYLSQANAADANVEARISREPFDWRLPPDRDPRVLPCPTEQRPSAVPARSTRLAVALAIAKRAGVK